MPHDEKFYLLKQQISNLLVNTRSPITRALGYSKSAQQTLAGFQNEILMQPLRLEIDETLKAVEEIRDLLTLFAEEIRD